MKKNYMTPLMTEEETYTEFILDEAETSVIGGGGQGSGGGWADAKERDGIWDDSENGGKLW